jgi:hypothetical protein
MLDRRWCALKHPEQGKYVKDKIYVVREMMKCKACCAWTVGAVLHSIPKEDVHNTCPCSKDKPYSNYYQYSSFNFAPLPPAYENISAALAKDATPETSDIIIKPITINN